MIPSINEYEKIYLTSGLTILGGIIVYVIGQWISRFIIDPLQEQKRAIGKIIDFLIYYANVYSNTRRYDPTDQVPNISEQAAADLRKVATELIARTLAIPAYGFMSMIGVVIPKKKIIIAHRNLIGISNSILTGNGRENKKSSAKIAEVLGFKNIFQPYGED